MLRIVKFVLDTADMGQKLVPAFAKGQLEWRLLGASDSDWASDKDNRKSASEKPINPNLPHSG